MDRPGPSNDARRALSRRLAGLVGPTGAEDELRAELEATRQELALTAAQLDEARAELEHLRREQAAAFHAPPPPPPPSPPAPVPPAPQRESVETSMRLGGRLRALSDRELAETWGTVSRDEIGDGLAQDLGFAGRLDLVQMILVEASGRAVFAADGESPDERRRFGNRARRECFRDLRDAVRMARSVVERQAN
jgi:hypothetical protein